MNPAAAHANTGPIDRALRLLRDGSEGSASGELRLLLFAIVVGSGLYGFAMGSYAGRFVQCLYSASKVPLLLGCTTLLCLPSFFVFNTVLGLRKDLRQAIAGVLAAQASMSVALLSLAPFVAVLYASGIGYAPALLGNGAMFALGTLAGQMTLRRRYRVLTARTPRHRIARRVWGALYTVVAIQLAWMLRPFIGSPDLPSQFFREEPFDNAYVIVGRTILRVLGLE